MASHDSLPIVICMCVNAWVACRRSLSWYHWKCIGFPVARWSHFASNGRRKKQKANKKNERTNDWGVATLCYEMEISSQTVFWLREWYSRYNCTAAHCTFTTIILSVLYDISCIPFSVVDSNRPKDIKFGAVFFLLFWLWNESCVDLRKVYIYLSSLVLFPSEPYLYICHHFNPTASKSMKYLLWTKQSEVESYIHFDFSSSDRKRRRKVVEIKSNWNVKSWIFELLFLLVWFFLKSKSNR